MRHFGIIEMGGRGGPGVPFISSKIVVKLYHCKSVFEKIHRETLVQTQLTGIYLMIRRG